MTVPADGHDTAAFDGGQPTLDEWLRASARDSDGRNLTRTYVWHRGAVIGFSLWLAGRAVHHHRCRRMDPYAFGPPVAQS